MLSGPPVQVHRVTKKYRHIYLDINLIKYSKEMAAEVCLEDYEQRVVQAAVLPHEPVGSQCLWQSKGRLSKLAYALCVTAAKEAAGVQQIPDHGGVDKQNGEEL